MSIVPRVNSELSSVFDQFPRDLWDPFPIDRCPFFRDFFSSVPFSGFGAPTSSLSASFVETPDAHVLKAYAPGVKKEEVKVEVEDGVITVSVPKKETGEVKRPERRTIEISVFPSLN